MSRTKEPKRHNASGPNPKDQGKKILERRV